MKDTILQNTETIAFKKPSQIKEIWRRLSKDKLAVFGLITLILIILLALSADLIVDYDSVIKLNVIDRLQKPSAEHIFGTDGYGRDVFARCIHGAKISLFIGFFSCTVATLIGSIIGALTGYSGGRLDNTLMRFIDIFSSIPPTLMNMAIIAGLGSGIPQMCTALIASFIPGFVRIVRSSVLGIANQEYIEACRAGGTSTWRILTKHILPNVIGPIIVQSTLSLSNMIINIATLSFLGLGIAQPTPEWGSMISEAKEFLRSSPYLMFFPAGMLCLTSFSISVLGDGLRDALDPRLKN